MKKILILFALTAVLMPLHAKKITRAEGAVLLVIYVVYTALLVKNALPSG